MKKISVEKKEEVKMILRSGLVGYEVAEKTGVSISTVNKIRKELQREGFDIWHRGGVVSSWCN